MAGLTKHDPGIRQPEPVFHPAVPAQLADLAGRFPALLARNTDQERFSRTSHGGGELVRRAAGTAAAGGTLALSMWLLDEFALGEDIDMGRFEGFDDFLRSAVAYLEGLGLLALVGGAVVATLMIVRSVGDTRRTARQLQQVRHHYVHPAWLTTDAALLLARAQSAADTILTSRLHQDDLGGLGTANRVHLAERMWTIADSLHRYSQAAQAHAETEKDQDQELGGLLTGERELLDQVLAGVDQQVVALEEYSDRAREVDRIDAILRTAELVEHRSGQVRDLVAETAAAQVGVAEITSLTASATAVAETLTEALEAARDAAATALPVPQIRDQPKA